ncbi:hypothetical protein GE21DRAFT_2599 [Neurospora crassa]|uniref:Uncharacterized protein n=1 Tax=Neurospora crassa (strain ATCC 24698 / 74-OR23-1A / CBS 708.71 / DSM 1257 / FGSC 987) TaxID=367110 RepID=Q7SFK2_NEUCR|nr:hypothetical protein NCU08617 [Neurospora crassa OR74A]EAA35589.2 hypothetical protein NCU08617 [Neurospora crassa OR74A]KHE81242.1 hypothetical protein GE21DRAFT_2599 [Neurospora crassa]|eukprot:XP_964825.2 hypothetical protein NCU08617 [Neurospora crassa OR74A]
MSVEGDIKGMWLPRRDTIPLMTRTASRQVQYSHGETRAARVVLQAPRLNQGHQETGPLCLGLKRCLVITTRGSSRLIDQCHNPPVMAIQDYQ